MFCQETFDPWRLTIMTHVPHLSQTQATGLALWSLGLVLARSCALTAVSAFLAEGLKQKENTVRQRLREWCYEAQAKRGKKRQEVCVETCFAPLLAWVLSGWTGTQLALALDATTLGDRFVVLAISVLYPLSRVRHSGGLGRAGGGQKTRLAPRVVADATAVESRRAAGLDSDRIGRSGLVCALVVPADRALGVASVFTDQQRRNISARGLVALPSPDQLGARGGHTVERSRHGL